MAHAVRYLIFVFALAGSVARGAGEQAVRFTAFSPRPIAGLAFAPRAGAAGQKVVFYPTARSPRYTFRGTMPLRFVDGTGQVVAEATIPPEIGDALLLFSAIEQPVADKNGVTLRYRIAVLDDSATRHGIGGLVVVNLSGLELSGNIGPHAVILKAGLNPTLAIGRSARIALRAAAKGKTYQSYADTVELADRQRALLLLFPPYYKGSLEAQSRVLIDEPSSQGRP